MSTEGDGDQDKINEDMAVNKEENTKLSTEKAESQQIEDDSSKDKKEDVSKTDATVDEIDKKKDTVEKKTENGKSDLQEVKDEAVNKTNNTEGPQNKKEEDNAKKEENDTLSLSDIAKINENITKTRVEGLQTLYMICFETAGKTNVVKKNLRNFTGFEFSTDSNKYKNKIEFTQKNDIKMLKNVCDILNLDKKGGKEEIVERIVKFLVSPNDEEQKSENGEDEIADEPESEEDKRKRKRSGANSERVTKSSVGRPRRATAGRSTKDLSSYVDYSSSEESEQKFQQVTKRRKRRDGSDSGSDYNPSGAHSDSDGGRKRQPARGATRGRVSARRSRRRNSDSEEESISSEEDSDGPKKKRNSREKKKGRPSSSRNKRSRRKDDTETEEEEEEESEIESADSEDDSKKKRGKTINKNNKTNSKLKSTPHSKEVAKKHGKSKATEADNEDGAGEKDAESEDEPLAKKTKSSPPTDDEIKSYVKEILDEANLEEITMKTVCKQVYAKYPDFDLTDKKDFIKATVKSLIAA